MQKKTLIVYYSLTKNTKFIADSINEAISADILELKPVKNLNAEGASKFLWGGMHAKMHTKPELEPYNVNPLDYDLIFIGSPVWAWTLNPVIRSFISKHNLNQYFKDKELVLWMCCAGDGIKAMERFKNELKNSNVISGNIFREPLKRNPEEAKKRAIDWAKKIII